MKTGKDQKHDMIIDSVVIILIVTVAKQTIILFCLVLFSRFRLRLVFCLLNVASDPGLSILARLSL
jgi:hypothetical protein